MTVIALAPRPRGRWSEAEIAVLTAALDLRDGESMWETGTTERGDAQLYVLGPKPEQACALCVSRIDGRYILEDGAGRLLCEHRSLAPLAQHARRALRGARWWLVTRVVALWCTLRHLIHDRLEPLLSEGEELMVHVFPQLAALA